MNFSTYLYTLLFCVLTTACNDKTAVEINGSCRQLAIRDFFSYRHELMTSGETAAHWNLTRIENEFSKGNGSKDQKKIDLIKYIQRGDEAQKKMGKIVGIRIRCGFTDSGASHSQVAIKYIKPRSQNEFGYALTYFFADKITATGLLREVNTIDGTIVKDVQFEHYDESNRP